MDLYNLRKNKLEEVDRVNFKLEKEIQTLVEDNVETLFDLEFKNISNKKRLKRIWFSEGMIK